MAKVKTTALNKYDKELAALAMLGAKTAAARAGTLAKTIGTEGARFTIDGKTMKDTTLDVVVEDFVLMNTLYTPGTKYNSKSKASPICFAFGRTEDEMVAHPDSTAPQGGTKYEPKNGKPGRPCVGCWANEWESAEEGKGKACQNKTRLGLITADSIKSAETIDKADVRFITVPVTSGKAWAAHEESVRETFGGMPVLTVVTQIEILPAPGGGHQLDFSVVQEVNRGVIGPLIDKHKKVAEGIDFPFPKFDPKAPQKGGRAERAAPAKASRPSSKGMAEAAAKAPSKGAGKSTAAPARKTKY